MGCLCIPNCVCHFELAKLNWCVLGEGLQQNGTVSRFALDRQYSREREVSEGS